AVVLVSLLALAAGSVLPQGVNGAVSLRLGTQTDSVHLGIHIGTLPPLVLVPRTPVYHAPSLPYNYFVYRKRYYLFHEGMWLTASHHDGPWVVIAVERVPRAIRAVPVDFYKDYPGHWKKHRPPPWAEARGQDWEKERSHAKGRGHSRGHD
ncbi:MAG TPA: hypothetical protein VEU07_03045, partial [Candidatus Acidoferrum sp.]|nr:hypothetical protein [Candidatus Acidoferrum sp.]